MMSQPQLCNQEFVYLHIAERVKECDEMMFQLTNKCAEVSGFELRKCMGTQVAEPDRWRVYWRLSSRRGTMAGKQNQPGGACLRGWFAARFRAEGQLLGRWLRRRGGKHEP
jgi:hypothetical protein